VTHFLQEIFKNSTTNINATFFLWKTWLIWMHYVLYAGNNIHYVSEQFV